MKCLEKKPGNRYPSAQILADDLERFLEGRPIHARRVSSVKRLAKWARRRPALATLLSVTAVALVVLLAVWARFTIDLQEARDQARQHAFVAGENYKEAKRQGGIASKNLAKAKEQEKIAKDNLAEAKRQKNLAISSLQEGQRTALTYLQLVMHDERLAAGPLEPLRKDLIQNTTKLYDKLIEHFGKIRELEARQATAYHSLARLTSSVGTPAEALPHYKKAIVIQRNIAAKNPAKPIFRRNLAVFIHDLGMVLWKSGQLDKAEAALQEAVDILANEAARSSGDNSQLLFQLAGVRHTFGFLQRGRGKLPEAERCYRAARKDIDEAIQTRKRIHHAGPLPDYLDTARRIADSLGVVYEMLKRDDDAKRSLQQALDYGEELLSAAPNYPKYQMGYVRTLINLGSFHAKRGDRKKALKALNDALAVSQKLVKGHPDVGRYRKHFAETFFKTGLLYSRQAKKDQAADAFQKSADQWLILVTKHPAAVTYACEYGKSLLELSRESQTTSVQKQIDHAIEILKRGKTRNPTNRAITTLLDRLRQVRPSR